MKNGGAGTIVGLDRRRHRLRLTRKSARDMVMSLSANFKEVGGADRNRTGIHGFAIRCVAIPPPRR